MSKASKLERLKRGLGMEGCFVVDLVGKKGGLALYWKNNEEVEIKSYSTWHINAEVSEEGQGTKWLFTGFYGHPEIGKMMFSWDMLRRNGFYTWSNRHNDLSFTKERGNEERLRRGKIPFRFEASWVKEEDCEEKIKQEWVRGQQSTNFVKKVQARLKFCCRMLVRCFKRKDKERTSEIDQITSRIKEVQEDLGHHNIEELKSLQKQVGGVLEQEDIKWRQRVKRNWYSLGDKNARFFHECANQRRSRNKIYTVVDRRGFSKEGEEEIEKAFHEHFKDVYKSIKPKEELISKCSITVDKNVTCEME
ncbi:uncharacterized protein LOC122274643 [Carya illinoinensis]|uniref:uncharacterized protein LOC122274643 n=1 Tax=Carya illinoinensis TaxID=32201 RepID=UPI001C728361|nr:uncharacterized protein LOC122274643 [Carya illinoinensis]